jgi:uncharacterized iron-regulated membrane protein
MTDATVSPATTISPPAAALDDAARQARLRPILWRLHFLGGFLAAPIALWLAVTGILFVWNPQVNDWLFGDEMTATVREGSDPQPLSAQLDAVMAAYPGSELISVDPAADPGSGDTTAVYMKPEGAMASGFDPAPGAFTAYVDPVSAEVTGHVDKARTPDEWLRNLHSNFRLGTRIGTLTELAASWVIVALITGLYLWWPRTRRALSRALRPDLSGLRTGGRRPWRNLHSSVGVVAFVVLATIVATGLTWTEYAGRWVDVAKDALDVEAPTLDTSLQGTAAGTGGGHAEHGAGGTGSAAADLMVIDRVIASAENAGLSPPLTVTPASEPGTAWTVEELDDRWPLDQTQVAVNPSSGVVVDRLEFSDQPLLDKATTIGIGFHEGSLFGLFNQFLLTVLALGVIVLLIAGYMTWWRRRPAGAFGAPPKMGSILRTVPIPLLIGFVVLMVLLPTLGVAFVAYLALERIVRVVKLRRRPAPAA